MCTICDGWRHGSGQATQSQHATPRAGSVQAVSGDAVASDPQPYVTFPRRWADHRGRTLTWSNATTIFRTQRQQDITYRLNDTQVGLIRRAFAIWSAVANVNFRQVADSTSTNIRIGWARFSGSDERALAYERSWTRGNTVVESVIVFDTNDNNSQDLGNSDNFLWVAVHEIGHALGLAHSSVSDAVMYASYRGRMSLHQDDIAAVQSIYGLRGGGPRPGPGPGPSPGPGPRPGPGPGPQTTINLGDITNASGFRARSGTVNRNGDPNDYYRFTLRSARTIRIELRNLSADADLYLESASRTEIARSINAGRDEDVIERRLGAGTYYIRVDAYGSGTIGYQLRYRAAGAVVRGGTRETALNLGNLTSVSGFRSRRGTVNRTSNDTDYFRFTLSAARTVRIELRGLTADADLYLESASGFRLASSVRGGTAADVVERRLYSGTYYIRVDAFGSGTIGYQLRYRAAGGGSPGSTRGTALNLGNLTNVSAFRSRRGTVNVASDDVDYFRFTLRAARTMRFELRGLSADADLYLENASGRVLDFSFRGSTAVDVIQRRLNAGTYYIRVDAFAAGTIGYQLRYRAAGSGGGREPGGTRGTALNLGDLTGVAGFRTRRGTVNVANDDIDYYRFRLTSTSRMRFELRGLSADADLYLENASGRLLQSSLRAGAAVDIVERTLTAGTYYVRVDAFSPGRIGYQLRHRTTIIDVGGTRATALNLGNLTNVSGNRTFDGTVNRVSDVYDYFRFTLSSARTMRFELRELSADADLLLYNASGQVLDGSVHFGTTVDVIQRRLGAGTYYVRVNAFDAGTIEYQLRYGRSVGSNQQPAARALWSDDSLAPGQSGQSVDRKPYESSAGMLAGMQ